MTMRQPSWNKFEAAILLDGLLSTINGTLSRTEAIRNVSIDLKRMAANQDVDANDLYRNENGITFQMHSMESAYYGRTIFKPASKLFTDIANLYHHAPEEFQSLLKEAKAMIENTKATKENFKQYLSRKVVPNQLSGLYLCYSEIEIFCFKLKVLQKPLLETTDFETIKKVKRTIERNKVFRITYRKRYNKILTAFGYYCEYLKEGHTTQIEIQNSTDEINAKHQEESLELNTAINTDTVIQPRTEQDERLSQKYPIEYKQVYFALKEMTNNKSSGVSIAELNEKLNRIACPAVLEQILDNVSWASSKDDDYFFSTDIVDHSFEINETDSSISDISENDIVYTINFEKSFDLSYSKPQTLTYCGEKQIFGSSWKDLYVKFVMILHMDYPHILVPGISFLNNSAHIDLSENTNFAFMTSPKPVPETNLMLETNLNANNIVVNIKRILELCGVDFNKVIITYKIKNTEIFSHDNNSSHLRNYETVNRIAFYQYLRDVQKMDAFICQSYVSAINDCEKFAKDHNFAFWKLYTNDKFIAEQTKSLLFANSDFQEYNYQQHNRLYAALQKYTSFLSTENLQKENAKTNQKTEKQGVYRNELIEVVLKEKFIKGFRMESPLEIRKLRRYYTMLNGIDLTETDEKISEIIKSLCIIYEGKAFLPDVMLDEELKEKLFKYIDTSFAQGKSAIYFQAIFTEFAEAFLDQHIYDATMLKMYLSVMGNGEFYINRSFISKEPDLELDPISEIRSCLIEYGRPVKYDEIFNALPHLPQNKIKYILSTNGEFISNGQGTYFHEKVLQLSEEELEGIASIISKTIDEKDFIGGNELYDSIKAKYSYIIEAYPNLSIYGFRDALKAKLHNRFSFKGNIISEYGHELSMTDVFAKYARNHSSFTLSELQSLAANLSTVIYFDAVYENSLRISKEQFVSKQLAQFPISDIDVALDRVCIGNYISIKEVTNFGAFPYAGFSWNSFLLEHYVADYSKKYKLLHSNFSGTECVGAIVRRSADIKSFDDLIVDLLVKNQIEMKKAPVLEFLRDNGYLARRRYSEIESLIIKANAQKQRKDEN